MFDFHSHVIPGVDDGAVSVESACAALVALSAQGVDVVVATPHVDGSLTLRPPDLNRRLGEIDEAWSALIAAAAGAAPDIQVQRGAEVMLDVPRVDFSDPRLRLGGGRAVLVEFAGMTPPPASEHVLAGIVKAGYTPVLAHPERYFSARRDVQRFAAWRDAGAVLQVNAGSLIGKYGERARATAAALLAEGLIDCIGSDYHARGTPSLLECAEYLDEMGGSEQRELLMTINPRRVVDELNPQLVPPIVAPPRRRFWVF